MLLVGISWDDVMLKQHKMLSLFFSFLIVKLAVGLPMWWKLVVGQFVRTIFLETLDTLGYILFFVSPTLHLPEGQTSHLDIKSGSCLPSRWFVVFLNSTNIGCAIGV